MARSNPEAPFTQYAYLLSSRALADRLAAQKKPDEAFGVLLESRAALEKLWRETPANLGSGAGLKVDFARRLGEIKPDLTREQQAIRGEILDDAFSDFRKAVSGGWRDDGTLKNAAPLKDRPGYAALLQDAVSPARKPAGSPVPGVAADLRAPARPQPKAAGANLDMKLNHATFLAALATAYAQIGKIDESFAMRGKAQALFDELLRQRPGDSRFTTGRIETEIAFQAAFYRLALERQKAGATLESDPIRKKADALYADLARELPDDPRVEAARLSTQLGSAGLHRDFGRWPECYRMLRDAESTARQLARVASSASTANPIAASALVRIGFEYGRLALWDEAASSLRKAYEIDPVAQFDEEITGKERLIARYRMALLFLHCGETDAYRRLCGRMLAEGAAGDVLNLIRTTTLGPHSLADWRPVLDLAQKFSSNGSWTPVVRGFALERAGAAGRLWQSSRKQPVRRARGLPGQSPITGWDKLPWRASGSPGPTGASATTWARLWPGPGSPRGRVMRLGGMTGC